MLTTHNDRERERPLHQQNPATDAQQDEQGVWRSLDRFSAPLRPPAPRFTRMPGRQFSTQRGLARLPAAANGDCEARERKDQRKHGHQQHQTPTQIAKQHRLLRPRRIHEAAERSLLALEGADLRVCPLLEVADVVGAAGEAHLLAVVGASVVLIAVACLRLVRRAVFAAVRGCHVRGFDPARHLLPAACGPPGADRRKIEKTADGESGDDERQTEEHRTTTAELFRGTHGV